MQKPFAAAGENLRQSVSRARTLIVNRQVLLIDEPFNNLDSKSRERLRRDVRQIVKASQISTIFVTHDQKEALFFGERMAVMDGGMIQQIDKPEKVVVEPVNRFVASFLGPTDFLPVQLKNKKVITEIGSLPVDLVKIPDADSFDLAVRADDIVVQPADLDSELQGRIEDFEFLGGNVSLSGSLTFGKVCS